MKWFTNWRLSRLRMKLAVQQAKLDHEMWLADQTGKFYPIALSIINETRAKVKAKIEHLEKSL